jgi:SAM-dependent methyltransferase
MSFRPRFDCLWCGNPWTTRSPDDLEGWAQLCSDCLGKAGTNPFLRGRLRAALAARAAPRAADLASSPAATGVPVSAPAGLPAGGSPAAFPDEWFLRRGPFARGAVHDTAWQAELDVSIRWLDGQPVTGRILEWAAGVGFFSPLLAGKGELHAEDGDVSALDRARARLVAHGLRAHLHPSPRAAAAGRSDPAPASDAATVDDTRFDAIVAAFVMGRVRGPGLDALATSLRARLRPGGRLALIDLLPDPAGGPPPATSWTWHDPDLVVATLRRAEFGRVEATSTGRFFELWSADAL